MTRTTATALAVALVVACGFAENRQKAEAAVAEFHVQLNDAKLDEIYESATPALRSSGSRADFVAYVEAVRRKLGTL